MDSRPRRAVAAREPAPGLFAYPFQVDALLANGVLVLARIGASVVPLVGHLLHFFIWLGVYNYAFDCLSASANGRAQPPVILGIAEEAAANHHAWLQGLVLIGLVACSALLGASAASVAAIAIGCLMPAAALSLLVTHRFLAALNPLYWWRTAMLLGPGYLPLMVGGAAINLLQVHAAALIPAALPPLLGIGLFYFFAHALVLGFFRAIGLAAHTHARELGYEAEVHALPANRMRSDDQGLLEEIERGLAAADRSEAERHAEQLRLTCEGGAGPLIQRRYRSWLLAQRDTRKLVAHARRFVGQLLALADERAALALVAESLKLDPDFLPADDRDSEQIVMLALRVGMGQMALSIAGNYRRSFPRRQRPVELVLAALALPLLADVGQRRAWLELIAERRGDDELGRRVAELLDVHPAA